MRWYFDVLTNNYLNFNGRARRKEFWMYTLVHLVILLLTGLIGMWPFTIYFVLTVIPSVGVGIRRLHDTGRSGWWILIANVPPIMILYYYFMLSEGDSGANIYGDSPKESYMDRIMKDNENDSSLYNQSTVGSWSFSFTDLDPEKLFGNEQYVQILIVIVIIISIILA